MPRSISYEERLAALDGELFDAPDPEPSWVKTREPVRGPSDRRHPEAAAAGLPPVLDRKRRQRSPSPIRSQKRQELESRKRQQAGNFRATGPRIRPRPEAALGSRLFLHSTISKDNTGGEGARQAEMLASLGRRLRRRCPPEKSAPGPKPASPEDPLDVFNIDRNPPPPYSPPPRFSRLEDNFFDDFDPYQDFTMKQRRDGHMTRDKRVMPLKFANYVDPDQDLAMKEQSKREGRATPDKWVMPSSPRYAANGLRSFSRPEHVHTVDKPQFSTNLNPAVRLALYDQLIRDTVEPTQATGKYYSEEELLTWRRWATSPSPPAPPPVHYTGPSRPRKSNSSVKPTMQSGVAASLDFARRRRSTYPWEFNLA
ncbi:hypothetical protein CMUS01_15759 [Colletotrichum musicola]|uniref:Uncharacterized protein n=1 Tax=Colletotrichum musicola TaxID=2175873 RepID=A0A8H6ML22_9PEZI|nr:hypothetical protein CMUS01_15759 [Colletotrichum musicola]